MVSYVFFYPLPRRALGLIPPNAGHEHHPFGIYLFIHSRPTHSPLPSTLAKPVHRSGSAFAIVICPDAVLPGSEDPGKMEVNRPSESGWPEKPPPVLLVENKNVVHHATHSRSRKHAVLRFGFAKGMPSPENSSFRRIRFLVLATQAS